MALRLGYPERQLGTVKDVPGRNKKDGSGRAAAVVAQKFAVSQIMAYQARSLLKNGSPELLQPVRDGSLSIKAAYRKLPREQDPWPVRAGGNA